MRPAISVFRTGEEHVREAVGKHIKAFEIMASQSGWPVTASIGVVTYNVIVCSYDELLGKADKLMYLAKERGKNAAEFMVIHQKSK